MDGIRIQRGGLPGRRVGGAACCIAAPLAALVLHPVAAGALTAPPGRAWTSDVTITAPGLPNLVGPRLDFDATTGTLRLATSAFGPSFWDALGFEWADSTWRQTWSIGAGTLRLWPVLSPPGTYHVIWGGGQPSTYGLQFMASLVGDQLVVDTVAAVGVPQTEYSAAVSPRRRWAAVGDYYGGMDNTLRMFYSDTIGSWHEVPVSGYANGGVSVGVLDDTTALVVWGGLDEGLEWATLHGTTWERGAGDPAYFGMYRVRMRPHPGGGHWVAWGMPRRYLALSHFANAAPGPVEWLDCNFPDPDIDFAYTNTPDLSRDDRERPVLAWGWSDIYGVQGICLCLPTESGYPVAEVVPNAWNAVTPAVAVDGTGDVWLAWQQYLETVHWMHTYVTAVAGDLTVSGSDSARRVAWRLSEPAPGSRWTVLRGTGDGSLEAVSSVEAGGGADLAWQDESALSEPARYRVRRESLDRRYTWTSDEVIWDPTTATAVALERIEVVEGRVELRWSRHGATVLEPRVERRTAAENWRVLGAPAPLGDDALAYSDAEVNRGARYAYRLAWRDGAAERTTPETWIEVPHALPLALEGFSPNPAPDRVQVAFTLPAEGRVRVEVHDVAGRRLLQRDAGVLPAGRHRLDLGATGGLAPGIYVIRLTFGARSVTTRGVVLR